MSSTVDVRLEEGEKPLGESDERTISRAVAEFSTGNGRTIDVRIVPYGISTEVADRGGPVYREMWVPGAFSDQVRGSEAGRAKQVFVNFEHGDRLSDVVGHGIALREEADGFYGSFELHDTTDGEKARYMVEHGLLDGVSLEAYPKKTVRSKDGIVQRVKAHLVNIALCRRPAYAGASVLALREEELREEATSAPALAAEIRERCHRIGMVLPDEVDDLIERAFTERPWDGSSSRWDTPEEYCSSCVIDLNPSGSPKTKQRCYLPIREPGTRDVNVNAVRNALSRLGAGFPKDASASQRASATATLERMLSQANAGASAANRQAPAAMMGEGMGGEAADMDAEQMSALNSILAMARQWAANEDDPQDVAAMNSIISDLERLGQTETGETD